MTKVAGVSSRGWVGGGSGAVLAGVSGEEISSRAGSEEGGAFSLRKVRLNLNPRSSSLLFLPAQTLWKCEFFWVLKLGIFGNRDKYVLLCWQV